MHSHAAVRGLLKQFNNPSEWIDSRLMKEREQQVDANKLILLQMVLAVVFLAKQAPLFRGHHEDKVDFSEEDKNRGNFIATLQNMARGIVFYESTFSLLKARESTQVNHSQSGYSYLCLHNQRNAY